MKLSKRTLSILNNFGSINPNIIIKPGNKLSTIAEAKNVLASAEVEETFEREIGIYDLSEFLNVISLFGDDCELEFLDKHATIEHGSCKSKYYYADSSILTGPTKNINMPDADVTVELTSDNLNKARKAASVMSHSVFSLVGDGEKVQLVVRDPKNTSSNDFSIDVNTKTKETFDLQFLITNLKLLDGDYKVEISSKLISKWSLIGANIEYYIALEKTSTYGG